MPADIEACVSAVMDDPDFEAMPGKTEEESAFAICQDQMGKSVKKDMKEYSNKYVVRDGKLHEKRHMWMPIVKNQDTGEYVAILSDTSTDRDVERISKSLLHRWSQKDFLPALTDHENSMEKYVGTWKELKFVEQGDHAALIGKPKLWDGPNELFAEGNRIKAILDQGGQVGVSISAFVDEMDDTGEEFKGTKIMEWKEAELLEGTFVPVQSNRNSFAVMAKSAGVNVRKVLGTPKPLYPKVNNKKTTMADKDKKKQPEDNEDSQEDENSTDENKEIDREALKRELKAEIRKEIEAKKEKEKKEKEFSEKLSKAVEAEVEKRLNKMPNMRSPMSDPSDAGDSEDKEGPLTTAEAVTMMKYGRLN